MSNDRAWQIQRRYWIEGHGMHTDWVWHPKVYDRVMRFLDREHLAADLKRLAVKRGPTARWYLEALLKLDQVSRGARFTLAEQRAINRVNTFRALGHRRAQVAKVRRRGVTQTTNQIAADAGLMRGGCARFCGVRLRRSGS